MGSRSLSKFCCKLLGVRWCDDIYLKWTNRGSGTVSCRHQKQYLLRQVSIYTACLDMKRHLILHFFQGKLFGGPHNCQISIIFFILQWKQSKKNANILTTSTQFFFTFDFLKQKTIREKEENWQLGSQKLTFQPIFLKTNWL